MDWITICKIEPRLVDLKFQAQHLHDWNQYEGIKSQMKRLVGFHAENEALRSSAAFDVAHKEIFG